MVERNHAPRLLQRPGRQLEKSGGVGVGRVGYLLTEDAKDAYDAQVNPGSSGSPLQVTWLYHVHALSSVS